MIRKIFCSIFTAVTLILLTTVFVIAGCVYGYFSDIQEQEMSDELELAALAVQEIGAPYLEQLTGDRYRLTWVSPDGSVRYDTQADAQTMENHLEREEIKEALQMERGTSFRYSATLTEKTRYEAIKLSDGSVLRISVSRITMIRLLIGMIQPIAVILILALILSAFLAHHMAGKVVEPLNHLNLEAPLENDTYEELSPLLHRIHAQHRQIAEQVKNLRQKTDEFTQITEHMQEGLVLLNKTGTILSINPAACRLFGTDFQCVGADFLCIERKPDLKKALEDAMETGHSEVHAARGGRDYQFDLSRIESDGAVLGIVLLAFDITEQVDAERKRREFTANVSHELKTPLQSIMGSAELIENALVKPEDLPRFVGHIRKEASRLLSLIEDIIRLSELDEGGEQQKEPIALHEMIDEIFSILHDAAQAKQVTLSVTGDATLWAHRRSLHEILYNLCDNAIKYNKEGGRVEVDVQQSAQQVQICVTDTGIGIPLEHQHRVFERFYRVDKSHSKQSGGTGLGLSIVKHAVIAQGGTISMESVPNEGTRMTITFPCDP